MWLESEPGRGSTFHFTARFARPRADGVEPERERGGTARAAGPATRLRVLVAEDSEVNRRFLTRVLEKRGHEVTTSANAAL